MPKIKFLEDRVTKEENPQSFKAGRTYNFPDDEPGVASARHWVNRQVAVYVDEKHRAVQPAMEPEEPEPERLTAAEKKEMTAAEKARADAEKAAAEAAKAAAGKK